MTVTRGLLSKLSSPDLEEEELVEDIAVEVFETDLDIMSLALDKDFNLVVRADDPVLQVAIY